jgi:fructan beta-fructosidase
MNRRLLTALAGIVISFISVSCTKVHSSQTESNELFTERHRPQFHFSPKRNWMNDPNGMIYFEGEYHLFFQHDRYEEVFTNMSWGHAISKDLIHWKEQAKALVPDGDSLGLIFSGSAVVDNSNTAGFGKDAFVAIYTSTHPRQQQSIAYSTDKGRTWTKYENNPVIRNEVNDDIPDDFRDPKVFWHEPTKKWIMSLAVKDHVEFWSSPNLLHWSKESEFGKAFGSHSGVWECPDLFEMPIEGSGHKRWVLLVSINPGGPNGGSATQYFVGNFDGKSFIIDEEYNRQLTAEGRWVDYGPDNYAGVTWSNVQDRKITIGWMNNWAYAMKVPTYPWRGAMTIPRTFKLVKTDDGLRLASWPVAEFTSICESQKKVINNERVTSPFVFSDAVTETSTYELTLELEDVDKNGFILELSNDLNQKVLFGYSPEENRFFIDRTLSGKGDFSNDFLGKHYAPRLSTNRVIQLRIFVDRSSVEVFADEGLTTMTSLFYSGENFGKLSLRPSKGEIIIKTATLNGIKKIW